MYNLTHQELTSLIKRAAIEAAIQTVEAYQKNGPLISAADIIRDIGIDLYNEGVRIGKLCPQRKEGTIKGKRWVKMEEYLRYKADLFEI